MDFTREELQQTIEAQREYIIEIEKKQSDLQQDFDITAKSIIGFARDFGIEQLISKNSDGNKVSEAKIYAEIGRKIIMGKINFSKLDALAPLFDKYKDQYSKV